MKLEVSLLTEALVPYGTVQVQTAADIVSGRDRLIEQKREELASARTALQSLKAAGAGHSRIDRLRERCKFIEKSINALEAGYVPIPRFDSLTLNIEVEELPATALAALAYAQNLDVFDEIRIVRGTQPQGGRGRQRRGGRDPLLVGVLRAPNHQIEETNPWGNPIVTFFPGREAHFLVAWWQPEDERDQTMF